MNKCANGHIVSGDYCHLCDTPPEKKKRKRIAPVSERQKFALKIYSEKRVKYLTENPICEVEDCEDKATTIHHAKGRIGELLNDTNFWWACCMDCHTIIENNPEWAKQEGYSESRLTN